MQMAFPSQIQSRTKLLEKVFPIMSPFLRNKTISKTTPLWKENPFPNSMLLPTNAQGSGFVLNTQQHCFQENGEREEPVQLRCFEKCCPSIQFSQQFCPRLQLFRVVSALSFILFSVDQCLYDKSLALSFYRFVSVVVVFVVVVLVNV